MIRLFTTVIGLLLFTFLQAQEMSELEKRNGFKDIKLGSIADSVKGVKLKKEFKEKEQFPAALYSVTHEDYDKIGEVKIKEIELKAYKSQIYEIAVVTEKDPRLMKALESLYGKADYDQINEIYFWKGKDMVLKFKARGKHQLEMVYISYAIHTQMKSDKNKKVDDIANDF